MGIPDSLSRVGWMRWDGSTTARDRLIDALELYANYQIPLRVAQEGAPVWTAAPVETARALPSKQVVLHGRDDARAVLDVQSLLDANVVFARVAKLERAWQVRDRGAWTDWDHAVAWAEDTLDPHGGQFDLPPVRGSANAAGVPLLGWRLDLAHGARPGEHGFPLVRLRHALGDRTRRIPLFDIPRCVRRGLTPMERIASRPVWISDQERVSVTRIDVADGTASVAPWSIDGPTGARPVEHAASSASAPRVIPLDELLRWNPELEPMLDGLRDQELIELRRRLEAHAAGGGAWRLRADLRVALHEPTLPLSGWSLAPDAFAQLHRGNVALAHPRHGAPVIVSARAAAAMILHPGDATQDLFGDPCSHPGGELVRVQTVDANGVIVARGDGQIERLAHSAFLRANEDLLTALLDASPDLPIVSRDPDLDDALCHLALVHGTLPPRLHEALAAPRCWTASPLARELLREAIANLDEATRTFVDHDGQPWRCVAVDPTGALVFDAPPRAGHAFPAPDGAPEFWLDAVAAPPRRLTPGQLRHASPRLSRALRAWQDQAGVLDLRGAALPAGARLQVTTDRAVRRIDGLRADALHHLHVSRDLREDPRKSKSISDRLERLDANLADLRAGRGVKGWIHGDWLARTGIGLGIGRSGGEHRIRINDGIHARWLGPVRWMMVAAGEAAAEQHTGALAGRLLDEAEGRVAAALRDATHPEDALLAARDAVLAASDTIGQANPFCSFVAVLQHAASGRGGVMWSGNGVAIRAHAQGWEPITSPQHADGIAQLASAHNLNPVDATSLILHLHARRSSRRELDETDLATLTQAAQRLSTAGRRRALRGGLGGGRRQLEEEHQRIQTLLRAFREARGLSPEVEAVDWGRAMLFVRRLTLAPGDRLVLGARGLDAMASADPLALLRATMAADPWRAAERIADWADGQPDREDLGVIVFDPFPRAPWQQTHHRRHDRVYRRTSDRAGLEEAGVFPLPSTSSWRALRVRPRALARYHADVEQLLAARRLPDPARDPGGFAEGLARWLVDRPTDRPAELRPEASVRELDEAMEERNDDPADETLLCWWLLRRRGVDARFMTGLRGRPGDPIPADTCWLELHLPGRFALLDLGFGGRPALRDAEASYRPTRSRVLRVVQDPVWWPRQGPTYEIPEPDARDDADPWVRLTPVQAPTEPAPAAPAKPAAAPVAAPAAPPPPAPTGWLDLAEE